MSVALTYNRNGATGGSVPVDATAYTPGVSATVQGNGGALNLAGYIFSGWNTAADGSGTTYAPGDIFAISVNTTLYAIWASASSLITPTQLREHVNSALSDAALQAIIDAEEQEIVGRYGAHASQVETFWAETPGPYLFPLRPVLSITSIVETLVWMPDMVGFSETTWTLDATDYEISPGGKELRRLLTGTHGRFRWGQRVVVTYVPVAETAKRVLALINLCKLNLNFTGLDQEHVGGREYSAIQGDYNAKREAILQGLTSNQRAFA